MPEIKNQFTGGKMNKDLDERLVPKGEYRDAMNMQVATSEGSDVGTAQNILGNDLQDIVINNIPFSMPLDAITVGGISDEKNDILYYLVWSSVADYIISFDGTDHEFVFIDQSKGILKFSPNIIITGINIIDDMLFWTDSINEPRKINIPRCIRGTTGFNQTELWNNSTGTLSVMQEEHVTVIRKGPQHSLDMEMTTSRRQDLIYTAVVNIFGNDDPADFTLTQPVGSSFIGDSFDSGIFDFSSMSTDPGSDTFSMEILYGLDAFSNEVDLNANTAAANAAGTGTLDGLTGWLDGNAVSNLVGKKVVLQAYKDDVNGLFEPPSLPLTGFVIKGEIKEVLSDVALGVPQLNSQSGLISNYGVKIQVTTVDGFPKQPEEEDVQLKYVIDIFNEEQKLFEFKFPRFSYRYKFEDGEYSTFAPFTQVAFVPGAFDYHPRKGFNLGMTNRLMKVELLNVITDNTPEDAVAVDILFKDDASPSIYVVDTLKPDDYSSVILANGLPGNKWNSILQSSRDVSIPRQSFVIEKEAISSIVPSNQLLRPWDNVPKKALGQDMTGNRIVYANYHQNYDLLSQSGDKYIPSLNVTHETFSSPDNLLLNPGTNVSASAYKSIKSLREYQLGVVFLDEFGRETPVLSNTTSTVKYEKDFANIANRFGMEFSSVDFPQALTHFKFFVKETSSEYYNLAMDRFYSAGDGNIWLSFPSSDRNKVDIDTFLIMKKGTDQDKLVEAAARYKILAIESEAPDFIKTTKRRLTRLQNANDIFPTSVDMPFSGASDFKVKVEELYGTAAQNIDTADYEVWVDFGLVGSKQVSDRYRVVGVTNSHVDKTETLTAAHNYAFKLDVPLGDDVDFISSGNDIESGAEVNIYRYKVENLDRFDGRFFVKIYFDDTFKKNIVAAEIGGGVRKVASRKVYLLDEHLIEKHTSELGRFATRNRGSSRASQNYWSPTRFRNTGTENAFYGYYGVDEFTANALYFRRYREKEYADNSDGVYGQFQTPPHAHFLNETKNVRALVHLTSAGNSGSNDDASAFMQYKDSVGEYWSDTHEWWKEFGYNTHSESTKFRGLGRTCRSGYGVTSGWKQELTAIGQDCDWDDFTCASRHDYNLFSWEEAANGYASDIQSARDTEVWFIDRGPNSGEDYDPSGDGTLKFNRPSLAASDGSGLTGQLNPTWNMCLGFGGVVPNNPTSSSAVWDGISDVPGFWDVGDWLQGGTTAANVNYSGSQDSGFISRINSAGQFIWDEDFEMDLVDGMYTIGGNVDNRSIFRHSDGRHLKHYLGDGRQSGDIHARLGSSNFNNEQFSSHQSEYQNSHEPQNLHSMAEGLSFNLSKQWRIEDVSPAIGWDPTHHGVIGGGLKLELTAVNDAGGSSGSNVVSGLAKQEDLIIYVSGLNETISGKQRTLHAGMALTKYYSNTASGTSTLITLDDPYVVRDIETVTGTPNFFKLRLGGYTQPFKKTEHKFIYTDNKPSIGDDASGDAFKYVFQQVGMNGYSPNSEFNINTIARPMDEGTNPGQSDWGAVAAVGYTLSWFDTLETTEIMSENPAIFETEPKDATELDIYHEASGSMPTVISEDTIASALPIGTRFDEGAGIFHVIGYSGPDAIVQGPVGVNPGTFGFWKFFRPDDLIVKLQVVQYASTTATTGTWIIKLVSQVVNPANKFILPWHNCYTFRNGVESNRIRDNFNLPYISNGVKASTTLEQEYKEEHRKYGLIYSGIYNSISGINNLNQFLAGEKITKDINPTYGSIQKLYSRDSDLVVLCEDKILRISANKDALYNADGNPQMIATDRVLGQTIPFAGEYGISTNPESFASESYRAYFADRVRGAVLRLSMDGLTPISDVGMKDWFRDNLRSTTKIIGSYDDRNQEYNIKLDYTPLLPLPGCMDPSADNYSSIATIDDGSCIYPVVPLYGCTDPTATNYDATATVDDGSCNFSDGSGCTDPNALNYDAFATSDDGSCLYGVGDLVMGPHNFGTQSPNELNNSPYVEVGGLWGSPDFDNFTGSGVCVFPPTPGSPVFGAHITKGLGTNGFQIQGNSVYTESHYWNLGDLTPGTTYKLSWKEIVLALRTQTQCSDCLIGGWAVRTDAIAPPIAGVTPTISFNTLNMATPIYDPVANGTLSQANIGYHQSNCGQDTTQVSTNTAGAYNGSESEWHDRCAVFTPTTTTIRVHFMAFTDFNDCTDCTEYPASTRHGAYVGLSELELTVGSC